MPSGKHIAVKRLPLIKAPDDYWRPTTRADCADIPRPCPYVSCTQHLFLDVKPNGNIRINFPRLEPDQLVDSCALDLAEREGMTLEEVGDAIGVTREMIRQMQVIILDYIRGDPDAEWSILPESETGHPLGRDGVRCCG